MINIAYIIVSSGLYLFSCLLRFFYNLGMIIRPTYFIEANIFYKFVKTNVFHERPIFGFKNRVGLAFKHNKNFYR